ncbi:MAG: hypothetical protein LBR81_03440, partial [Prevotellaceae bacterium]|nr:hypothetical protein [Prevotellaceae bacterium]
MKSLKLLSVSLAILVCSSVQAQNTPEAIIGQCPFLPSVADLSNQSDNPVITDFDNQIEFLRKKSKEAIDKRSGGIEAATMQDAEKMTQQMTGRSVSQLQNMSKAEQQAMGQQMAQQQLAAAGMGNMSMADLQALSGKSDEEMMAVMMSGSANSTGLTAAELKAMENMTDAQIEAYMKQGDRMQRMQAAASTPQAKKQQAEAQAASKKGMSAQQISTEIQQINSRWQDIDKLNAKETAEAARKIAEIQARYNKQINAIPRSALAGGHESTYSESEQKAVSKLYSARDTECYTLWRNQVSQM